MGKMRAVVIHANGAVTVADGKIPLHPSKSDDGTPYDLDGALAAGGTIVGNATPIGNNSSAIVVLVQEAN
jgi:hypothetical protein